MALKSTVYKAELQLADIDHQHYETLNLTLARHPSETDERMLVRLVALALNAWQVQALCAGDGRLGFGAGLSDPDEPDAQLTDFTGRTRLWLQVGQPDERALTRAAARADTLVIYPYGSAAEVWWRGLQNKVARLRNLSVWRLPAAQTQALATLAERSMQLQATVLDGVLTLGSDKGSVSLEPQRWQ